MQNAQIISVKKMRYKRLKSAANKQTANLCLAQTHAPAVGAKESHAPIFARNAFTNQPAKSLAVKKILLS